MLISLQYLDRKTSNRSFLEKLNLFLENLPNGGPTFKKKFIFLNFELASFYKYDKRAKKSCQIYIDIFW